MKWGRRWGESREMTKGKRRRREKVKIEDEDEDDGWDLDGGSFDARAVWLSGLFSDRHLLLFI